MVKCCMVVNCTDTHISLIQNFETPCTGIGHDTTTDRAVCIGSWQGASSPESCAAFNCLS